jgi:protein-L-isoaspartate(D-aspartate) O-methyltransferase
MSEINTEQARYNMIEQQIRPWEVLDQRVLDVLSTVRREAFVPDRYRRLAFTDVGIPLGHDQVMMNPNVEGRMLQALAVRTDDKILEIGTGSGYISACLAQLGQHLVSIDIQPDFIERAQQTLARKSISNVRLESGDAMQDWPTPENFDVIAVTGALPQVPDAWYQRLNLGGRLFAIVGKPPIMEALLITRTEEQAWITESLFETELAYLLNSASDPLFEF